MKRCAVFLFIDLLYTREDRYLERAAAWAWAVRSNSSGKKNGSDLAAEL